MVRDHYEGTEFDLSVGLGSGESTNAHPSWPHIVARGCIGARWLLFFLKSLDLARSVTTGRCTFCDNKLIAIDGRQK